MTRSSKTACHALPKDNSSLIAVAREIWRTIEGAGEGTTISLPWLRLFLKKSTESLVTTDATSSTHGRHTRGDTLETSPGNVEIDASFTKRCIGG